jgi:hypothetical protein
MKVRSNAAAALSLPRASGLVALVLPSLLMSSVAAQTAAATAASQVYRCPGPPVLYTDALSPQEAREKGCRTIEGSPITVIQAPRPRPPAATAGGNGSASTAPRPADSKVEPTAQRQRDSEARRILLEELKKEEDKLAAMQKDFNNGEPERRGDERNYQRYLDRVADMKAAITRKEADISALKREIAKLPPT